MSWVKPLGKWKNHNFFLTARGGVPYRDHYDCWIGNRRWGQRECLDPGIWREVHDDRLD